MDSGYGVCCRGGEGILIGYACLRHCIGRGYGLAHGGNRRILLGSHEATENVVGGSRLGRVGQSSRGRARAFPNGYPLRGPLGHGHDLRRREVMLDFESASSQASENDGFCQHDWHLDRHHHLEYSSEAWIFPSLQTRQVSFARAF